jgi:hypothetical protein
MCRACSTYERENECIQVFGAEIQNKKDEENQYVGGGIVLKCILEKYDGVSWVGFIWLRILTCGELLRLR